MTFAVPSPGVRAWVYGLMGVINLGMDFEGGGRHKGRMKTYDRFKKRELILRDELAIDRTLLANKSTLLSFMQLSISLTIAGVSIIHFAMEEWFRSIGVLCVPVGVVVGILGWRRYWKMEAEIGVVRMKGIGSKRAGG
jgi:putative membrane protein